MGLRNSPSLFSLPKNATILFPFVLLRNTMSQWELSRSLLKLVFLNKILQNVPNHPRALEMGFHPTLLKGSSPLERPKCARAPWLVSCSCPIPKSSPHPPICQKDSGLLSSTYSGRLTCLSNFLISTWPGGTEAWVSDSHIETG